MAGRSFNIFLGGDAQKESQARTRAVSETPEVEDSRSSLPRNVGSTVDHTTNTDFENDLGVLRSNASRTGVSEADQAKSSAQGTQREDEVYKIGENAGLEDYINAKQSSARMTKANNELVSLNNSAYSAPEPSLASASNTDKINATQAWAMLKAAHGALKQHFDSLPTKVASRAAAYQTTANNVAKIAPDHPSLGHLNEGIQALTAPLDRKTNLKMQLGVNNKLVDAQAKLHSIKELDETGHIGKHMRTDVGSDVLHSNIKDAARLLTQVASTLHNGPYANYGVGSPVHPAEMQSLSNRIETHLTTKRVKDGEAQRDIDEVTGAKARPGHVWVGTREDGNLEQMEATPDNLKLLRAVHGSQSKSYQRMRSFMNSGKTRRLSGTLGVETRNVPAGEVPVVEAGRGGHVTVGKETITGGKTISAAAPRTAEAFAVTPQAKATRKAVFEAARSGILPSEAAAKEDAQITESNQGTYNEALGHVRAGRRIPKELRAQMHPTVVAAVLKQARDEKKAK